MQRYIERNWFNRIKGEVNNPSDGNELEKAVITDKDNRPARLLQMIAGITGLVLVLAGFLIFLQKILGSSSSVAKIMTLLPVILGAGFYFFYKTKQEKNDALRELSSAFLFLTFTISLFTSIVSFEIKLEPDQWRFILYIAMAAGLALTFVNRSSLTAFFFLFGLLTWANAGTAIGLISGLLPIGRMGGDMLSVTDEMVIVFWLFFAGIIKYLVDHVSMEGRSNLKTVLLGWLIAFIMVRGAIGMTGGHMVMALSGAAFSLYVFGKKFYGQGTAFWNRPFQTTAILASVFLILTLCHDTALGFAIIPATEFETPQILGLVVSLALLGGSGYYYFENHWKTGDKLNMFMALIPILGFLSWLLGMAKESDIFSMLAVLYTLAGLVLFGNWLKAGVTMKHPPIALLGAVTAIVLLIGKAPAFGMESQILLGFYLIVIGAAAVFFVLSLDKLWNMGNFGGVLPSSMENKINDSASNIMKDRGSSAPKAPENNDQGTSDPGSGNDSTPESGSDEDKPEDPTA